MTKVRDLFQHPLRKINTMDVNVFFCVVQKNETNTGFCKNMAEFLNWGELFL